MSVDWIDETKDRRQRIERMRAAHQRARQKTLEGRGYVQYVHGQRPLKVTVHDRRAIDIVLVLGGLVLAVLLMTY